MIVSARPAKWYVRQSVTHVNLVRLYVAQVRFLANHRYNAKPPIKLQALALTKSKLVDLVGLMFKKQIHSSLATHQLLPVVITVVALLPHADHLLLAELEAVAITAMHFLNAALALYVAPAQAMTL